MRSVAREIDDVAPRRRLAAGKMHMQRAERGRLAEHPLPGLAIKLIAGALERHADWSNRDSRAGSDG